MCFRVKSCWFGCVTIENGCKTLAIIEMCLALLGLPSVVSEILHKIMDSQGWKWEHAMYENVSVVMEILLLLAKN